MVYCRSCGMSMSETATLCPACGAAVAATPAAAAPDAPALIATVRLAPGWPGKTITYAAGRFTLEGSGEITPQDVLAYDAEGQLDWAYGGLLDWVVQLSSSPPPSATTAVGSRPASLMSGTTQPRAAPKAVPRGLLIAVALCSALSYVVYGGQGGLHYYVWRPSAWLPIAIAGALVVSSYLKKRR
jgi:zinc-ribbon domain